MKFLLRGALGALFFLFSVTFLSAQSDYRLALGSFLKQDLAQRWALDLGKAGIATETRAVDVKGKTFYRIFSQKSFPTVDEAQKQLKIWAAQKISPKIDFKSVWVLEMGKDFPPAKVLAEAPPPDKKEDLVPADPPKPGPEPTRPQEETPELEILTPEMAPEFEPSVEVEPEREVSPEPEEITVPEEATEPEEVSVTENSAVPEEVIVTEEVAEPEEVSVTEAVIAEPEPEPEPLTSEVLEVEEKAELETASEPGTETELVRQIRRLIAEGDSERVKSWVLESSALYGYDFIVGVLEYEVEREPSSPAIEALYFAYLERQGANKGAEEPSSSD